MFMNHIIEMNFDFRRWERLKWPQRDWRGQKILLLKSFSNQQELNSKTTIEYCEELCVIFFRDLMVLNDQKSHDLLQTYHQSSFFGIFDHFSWVFAQKTIFSKLTNKIRRLLGYCVGMDPKGIITVMWHVFTGPLTMIKKSSAMYDTIIESFFSVIGLCMIKFWGTHWQQCSAFVQTRHV